MVGEFIKFYTKIKWINGDLVISIPEKLVLFEGLKLGDPIKVMLKKEEVHEDEFYRSI